MTATRDITKVKLQRHQFAAWTAPEPEVTLLTGLGGGKTHTGARWILLRALEFPESLHLVTINSYTQGGDTVIPAIDAALNDLEIEGRWRGKYGNSPVLFIDVGDAIAEIRVRSTKNFDGLRGPEYGSWWADEVRDAPKEAIKVVKDRLRCQLLEVPSYLWTTSPNGHDEIWKRHAKGAKRELLGGNPEDGSAIWKWTHPKGKRVLIQADTRANRKGREGYADDLAQNHDPKMLKQERGGEFITAGDLFYHAFDYDQNITSEARYDADAPLAVTLDFNRTPYCSLVLVQEKAGRTLAVAEIQAAHTQALIELFMERFPERTGRNAPDIYGDASGHHKQSTASEETDYTLWRKAMPEVEIYVPYSNPRIIDRQNAVNTRLCNGHDVRNLLINPECELLIADFEQLQTKEGTREPDKSKKHLSHMSDALGYYVVDRHPVEVHIDREAWASELEGVAI